jgi:GT2 family glycosyltransferase
VGPADPVEVVVVVVMHESADHLPRLIDSLDGGMAGTRWSAVFVDNASTDQSVELAHRVTGSVVVECDTNVGFGAGTNVAIGAAPGREAVLVLNPDIRLHGGCARRLLEAVRQPGIGIAVPRLVDGGGRLSPSLRREPTVLRAVGEAVLGGGRAGRYAPLGEMIVSPARYRSPGPAVWASGAAWMISDRCLRRIGGYDETFFLYWEEVDLALRARDAGEGLQYLPDATATHLGGHSNTDPSLFALMVANRARGFRRHHGPLRSAAYRSALVVGEIARAASGRATSRAAVRALLGDAGVLPPAAREALGRAPAPTAPPSGTGRRRATEGGAP